MNNTWTRNADGSYTRDGWTIRQAHHSGSGQSRPFAHVAQKAHNLWSVYDPDGFLRTGSRSLSNAKINADRQISLRMSN